MAVEPCTAVAAIAIVSPVPATREQGLNSRHDRRQDLGHLQVRQLARGRERDPVGAGDEDAIDHERVDVHIEIQRPSESLYDSHPSTKLGMVLSEAEGPRRPHVRWRRRPAWRCGAETRRRFA